MWIYWLKYKYAVGSFQHNYFYANYTCYLASFDIGHMFKKHNLKRKYCISKIKWVHDHISKKDSLLPQTSYPSSSAHFLVIIVNLAVQIFTIFLGMSVEIVYSKEFHSHDGFIHQWLSFGFLHHNGRTIEKELRVSTDYWILAIICFKLFGKDTGLEFTYRSERIFTPRTTPPCFQIVLAKLQEVVAKCSGVAHFAMIIISYKGIVCILLLLKFGLWSNANNSHFLRPILPSMDFFYDERLNISSYFWTKLLWINKNFNHLMTKDYSKIIKEKYHYIGNNTNSLNEDNPDCPINLIIIIKNFILLKIHP